MQYTRNKLSFLFVLLIICSISLNLLYICHNTKHECTQPSTCATCVQLEKSKDTLDLIERMWIGSVVLALTTMLISTYKVNRGKHIEKVTTLVTLSVRLDC